MAFTVADYIVARVAQQNVDALFGVPAVYCSAMFEAAANKPNFHSFVTSSDLVAGYAADGYARARGLSLLSVAYGVGTLSALNAVAGAYIERSPIMVINGGPSQAKVDQQTNTGILFSHSMGRPHSDMEAFKPFTCFCERATSQAGLPGLIDRAIVAAVTKKHPVYLEIPQAWLQAASAQPSGQLDTSIPVANAQAVATRLLVEIRAARSPLVIVGVEIQRYGLTAEVLSVLNKLNLQWASTLLAKSVLPENHPKFLGVFNGEEASAALLTAIGSSDLIVALGAVFGSGHATTMVPKISSTVRFWDGKYFWRRGDQPQDVPITHFARYLNQMALAEMKPATGDREDLAHNIAKSEGEAVWDGDGPPADIPTNKAVVPTPVPNGLTYDAVFDTVAEPAFLDSSMTVVADTFLGIYSAATLKMPSQGSFVASAIWASIGHSVGAVIGVAAAGPKRPVVICGDGGAQMVFESLSTMALSAQPTIVLLVDNGLYGYEQWLLDPSYFHSTTKPPVSYAALNRWDYGAVAQAIGVRFVRKVDSITTLRAALADAKAYMSGPSVIVATVQSRSLPKGL